MCPDCLSRIHTSCRLLKRHFCRLLAPMASKSFVSLVVLPRAWSFSPSYGPHCGLGQSITCVPFKGLESLVFSLAVSHLWPWSAFLTSQAHQQFSVQRPSTWKKVGEKECCKQLAEEMLIQIWLETVFSLTRLRNPGSGERTGAVTECRVSCFAARMSSFAGLWGAKCALHPAAWELQGVAWS